MGDGSWLWKQQHSALHSKPSSSDSRRHRAWSSCNSSYGLGDSSGRSQHCKHLSQKKDRVWQQEQPNVQQWDSEEH